MKRTLPAICLVVLCSGAYAQEALVSREVAADPIPVRNAVPQPGREIVTLRHFRIRKGGFDRFFEVSREGVWPYFEKIGARVVGQWKVEYFVEGGPEESPDYDEVYMMVRYASYDHWRATRQAVELGGNGPDFMSMQEALRARDELILETSVQVLVGDMYQSPPLYMPGLGETYRLIEGEN